MENESPNSSPPANYAFLNHSTTTVPNNLPPSVDDKPLARQKRRRTSPEDQAVLEAAYKRDPKPDKTARLELVKKVALGEKEVQIWFQNRRQSSRRKSRPLLPHEIAQYQASRAGIPVGSPASSEGQSRESSPPTDPASNTQEVGTAIASVVSQHEHPLTASTGPGTTPSIRSQPLGYLANRRSAASLRESFTEASEPIDRPEPTEMARAESGRRIKKTTSFVRLSLNAEGKAEVVTKDAASPSPPRHPQTLLPDVTSAAASSAPAAKQLQRSYSGRSRDSRAWEFWCDKGSRSEFENTAEKDASGSAAGAIGLLRTTSGRNILGNLSTKRNAAFSTHHPNKRSKSDHKRPPLQRSNTSLGRLQGRPAHRTAPKLKHSESAAPMPGKGTESDKENVSPHSDARSGSPFPDRFSLGRDQELSKQRMRLSHVRRERSSGEDVIADPENDEELSAFMRGGQRKASVSGDDDLDCVQGLLSLSQGNWR